MRFLLRRTINSSLLLIAVSLFAFVLFELAPGDFFDELRLNPQISEQTVAKLRSQYGIDQSLLVKYLHWLRSVARGEFGFSLAYNSPVAPLLWERARNTLLLTCSATLLAWAIAVPLGIWVAAAAGRLRNLLFDSSVATLLSVPDVMLALGVLLAGVHFGFLPVGGITSLEFGQLSLLDKVHDLARHCFLPVLCLVLGILPVLLPHVRAAAAEVLNSPFITAARGHGISRTRLLLRHVLPAAAGPLTTLVGFSIASLLSASLLIEVVMSWPGLGPLLVDAIRTRDLYVVVGVVMASTLFLVAGNLFADALLYLSDPRIRTERA